MGIYMHASAYRALKENAAVSCYELVMAEPVRGFVKAAAGEKFPIGSGEIVDNTYRFDTSRLLAMLRKGNTRSMHLGGAVYPYWENAARGAEDAAMTWLASALLLALMPAVLAVWAVISFFVYGKSKLEDEYIPETKEKLEEAIRVRQRRRWEKKHPDKK